MSIRTLVHKCTNKQTHTHTPACKLTLRYLGGGLGVEAEIGELVGAGHVLVEDGHGDLHKARVRHPRAVVPSLDLAQLVRTHLGDRSVIGGRIVLDRDLRRHAYGWAVQRRSHGSRPHTQPAYRPWRVRRGGGTS
jgi:hypothetical protein